MIIPVFRTNHGDLLFGRVSYSNIETLTKNAFIDNMFFYGPVLVGHATPSSTGDKFAILTTNKHGESRVNIQIFAEHSDAISSAGPDDKVIAVEITESQLGGT